MNLSVIDEKTAKLSIKDVDDMVSVDYYSSFESNGMEPDSCCLEFTRDEYNKGITTLDATSHADISNHDGTLSFTKEKNGLFTIKIESNQTGRTYLQTNVEVHMNELINKEE